MKMIIISILIAGLPLTWSVRLVANDTDENLREREWVLSFGCVVLVGRVANNKHNHNSRGGFADEIKLIS